MSNPQHLAAQLEVQRRSIAMLSPQAWALRREEALALYDQLLTALHANTHPDMDTSPRITGARASAANEPKPLSQRRSGPSRGQS